MDDDDGNRRVEHGATEGHSSNTAKKKKRSRGGARDSRDSRDSNSRDCEHTNELQHLRESRDYWRDKSAQLEVTMQGMKEEHGAEMRTQRLQYVSLRGEWGRQKLELAACQDQLEDAEMARALLEINNDELFRKLHGLNVAIARMQQKSSSSTDNSTDVETDVETNAETNMKTLCMCCCDANIDTVFRCKHAVMCEDCVVRMLHHADENDDYNDGEARCPVCRDPISFTNAGQSSNHDFLLAPYTRIYIGA